MRYSRAAAPAHAPGVPAYELHTLGWQAFQDLCAVVLREVWDQSVQSFADTRDGGRDGAFYGTWRKSAQGTGLPEGPVVIQCKFIARRDVNLTRSMIDEELDKVDLLAKTGLCQSYVLMSNAKVTGASEAAIRKALLAKGVACPLVLAGNWLSQTIAMNPRLRMLVPRVYGLGDLSQILDERAYQQAQALLDYLREDLSTFVVTDAYRRAAKAIEDHGFCLLLGEPAAGKSVIAATLAITAVDQWGIPTLKVDGPADVAHWNPHEPHQFFWADDAFGQIRHDRALTDDWARRMPKVMAAIKGGSKVVMTSRDYIYRDARKLLKDYSYPLLSEQQVVIDVAELTQAERRQILYNHLRLGDQPAEFKTTLKPHLSAAADQEPFRPEVARRLGHHAYTRTLRVSPLSVSEFMARPSKFLQDIFEGLEPDLIGAMAMVYQAGDLAVPLGRPTREHEDLLLLIGSSYGGLPGALAAIEGTFLRRSPRPGSGSSQEYWTFRHPTLREGFADFMASNPNWLEIFIRGLDDDGILTQLDCGSGDTDGTLVSVPPPLYGIVAERVARARTRARGKEWRRFLTWADFLAYRCSREFLEAYLARDPNLVERSLSFGPYMSDVPQLPILARLHEVGLLAEQDRLQVRETIGYLAVEEPDAGWIGNDSVSTLLAEEEFLAIQARIKNELVPGIDRMLRHWKRNEQGESAESYYQPLLDTLDEYIEMFRDYHDDQGAVHALQQARNEVVGLRIDSTYWDKDDEHRDEPLALSQRPGTGTRRPAHAAASGSSRDIFDDIDE